MKGMSSKQQGLTLVELMVTLAVAIILVAVGMPLFSGVAANNRAVTEANTFLAAFKLARSEAVKRATEVSVCAVADPAADPVVCSSTNSDWTNGLIVFTDGGTGGAVDGTDERIRVFANESGGATATASTTFVTFAAQGEATAVTNTACSTSETCIQLGRDSTVGSHTRCVHVMASGQVRLERDTCS